MTYWRARERPFDRPLGLSDLEGAARARAAPATSVRFCSSANHSAIDSARSGPIPRPPGSPPGSPRAAGRPSRSAARGSARSPSRRPGCSARRGRARTAAPSTPRSPSTDVRRRDLLVALELGELLGRQPVEVGHRAQQPELPEPAHELLADALDVHRRAHPVDQRLEPARGARAVRAAVHHLALGLHDLGAAERAVRSASGTPSSRAGARRPARRPAGSRRPRAGRSRGRPRESACG